MRPRVLICLATVVLTALVPIGEPRAAERGETPGVAIAEQQEVRDVIAFGESVEVAGTVTDAVIAIASNVQLTPTARIGGDIYVVGGTFTPSPGARLGGSVTVVSPVALQILALARFHLVPIVIILLAARFAFILAVWVLAWHLAPTEFADRQAHRLVARPVRVLGLGLLWTVLLGVGGIVASLTMIGLPLGLLLVLVLAGGSVVGLAVALSWIRKPAQFAPGARHALVASMMTLELLPIIGEALLLAAATVGLGGMLAALAEVRGRRRGAVFAGS